MAGTEILVPIEPVPSAKRAKRRVWRWLIPVLAVVVVGGGALAIILNRQAAATPEATTTTRDVQAAMVTMTTTVSASGTIAPLQRADLSFSSSGTVTAVKVAVGDTVTKGEAVATIDTTNLQASVDSAQAAVDAAQSDYDTAVSDGVDAKITATKSTLATKQDALANAKSALAAGTLKAPFDGTVAIVTMAVGDTVGSGSSGGGGSTGGGGNSNFGGSTSTTTSSGTITIISTNQYAVTTSVGASDVTSVSKGQDVEVTPNGAAEPLKGKVTSVGLIASSSTSSGAAFPVTVEITDAQPGLYAGVSASLSIITSSRSVLAVPSAAVTTTNGVSTVDVKAADGTITPTTVTTGDSTNSMTEITSGLKSGDTVQITTYTGGNAASSNPNALASILPGGGGNRPQGNFTMPAGFNSQFPGAQQSGR